MADQQQGQPITDPLDDLCTNARELADQLATNGLNPILLDILSEMFRMDTQRQQARPMLQQLAGSLSQFRYAHRDAATRVAELETEIARLKDTATIDAVAADISDPTPLKRKA